MSLAKNIRIKRVYAAPSKEDGKRVLVDRLWPRGLAKEKARIDRWLKDVAPSHDLRKRFHGNPDAWDTFREEYARELGQPDGRRALEELRELASEKRVTLLYASRDESRNNAEALRLLLAEGE